MGNRRKRRPAHAVARRAAATMSGLGVFKTNVFGRTNVDGVIVTGALYNVIIGLVLGWGFLVNWIIVRHVRTESLRALSPAAFFIGYFALCLLGVYLFNRFKDPAISFLGYNLVVVPFGLVLNMVVSLYDPNLVRDAILVTGTVTVVMMLLGALFQKFFEKIGVALAIALLAALGIEVFQVFVLHVDVTWIDWLVALIFCGYIGYDWGRANSIPKTVDNAIDSAAAIYMDILNFFVRTLDILGSEDDS